MRVALFTTFRADRKEPLGELVERVHRAFQESGLGEPVIHFTFGDAPLPGFTSAVDRALKKFPKLEVFRSSYPLLPGAAARQVLSNAPGTPGAGNELDLFTLFAIAKGVPRSLPFHSVMIHFHRPEFGEALPVNALAPARTSGIIVGDSWWVNGRNRSLSALTVVEAEDGVKNLPPPPAPVAAILAACGKVKATMQLPLPGLATATSTIEASQADPEVGRRVGEVMLDYRARMPEIVERAGMPHELPSAREALTATPLGTASGPKKPALVTAFRPLGYDCRGESGTFTLRRKTAANLSVEVSLDVGTWSNSLTGFYEVHGLGFTARLPLPPAKNAGAGQYQIGDAARWQKIVENLAALVKELDRTFVPAIEAASGPAPSWFKTGS